MASLQRFTVRGHTYWRIVESRRVNGKPRLFVLAHLGKADDVLARLQGADSLRLRSLSHGAVAAAYALARELDLAGTIDRHLKASGRRDHRKPERRPNPRQTPKRHDGLTTGRSLELACVGRTCHATSKRGFAEWARTTTLGDLASVNVRKLTSQHFWDQMDQVPVEALAGIEREVVDRAIKRFQIPVDTALYDATNFFTFIASTNTRCELPARGRSKQKRHDLRQLGVALLCTRGDGIPLMHRMYGGSVADARCFAEVFPNIRRRLVELGQDLEAVTVIYDKGNMSKANQGMVDKAKVHYVSSVTAASQRDLVEEANAAMEPVELSDDEKVPAYRTRSNIWGAERTVVVLLSERLRAGQLRGIRQHLASALRWFEDLADTLRRGKQKRDRARIERDIEKRLMGRQHLNKLLRVRLSGQGRKLRLEYELDRGALKVLARDWLGRQVLVTDRDAWDTADIIRTYRGQAQIEAVFEHFKDPMHVMLRPQYHWTDQKLHVHVFTCVMGYLLGRLLHLRAQRAVGYGRSMERLLKTLAQARRVTVLRSTGPKKVRVSKQAEDMDPEVAELVEALGVRV